MTGFNYFDFNFITLVDKVWPNKIASYLKARYSSSFKIRHAKLVSLEPQIVAIYISYVKQTRESLDKILKNIKFNITF